jgi:hypothetical protein
MNRMFRILRNELPTTPLSSSRIANRHKKRSDRTARNECIVYRIRRGTLTNQEHCISQRDVQKGLKRRGRHGDASDGYVRGELLEFQQETETLGILRTRLTSHVGCIRPAMLMSTSPKLSWTAVVSGVWSSRLTSCFLANFPGNTR